MTDATAIEDAPQTLALTPEEALRTAMQWHQQGQLEQARILYERVTAIAPELAETWHFLGLLHYQLGAHAQGMDLVRQSLQRAPAYADAWSNLGNMRCDQGEIEPAVAAYREAVRLAPERLEFSNNLGLALKLQGQHEEAERLWRDNLARAPEQPLAYDHLGQLCLERGELDEARRLLETATRLNPDFPAAFRHLGLVLSAQEHHEQAATAFARAVELGANAYLDLAKALREQGLIDAAIGAYRQALDIGARDAMVYYHLVMLLNARGRGTEALEMCQAWLEAEPDNSVAQHMLAAIGGAPCPERASDAYVQSVFDGFAGSFEQRLKQLRYRAPELVADLLTRSAAQPHFATLLDAGCGTGLCAPLLRPLAERLVGVDLSTGMLEKAASKQLYDELIAGELTAFLTQKPQQFDAIVCADTLVYFGDLSECLRAAARALTPDGLLVATLEQDESADRYRLQGHGRYGHSSGYLEEQLQHAGLTLIALETVVLRREMAEDVTGLLFCAQAPAPSESADFPI